MNNKSLINQKGQNILELVVGLGLVAVVAVAISVVTVNALKNSQFSKNQSQATKLAQETLEKVRTVRNSNFGVCSEAQMIAGSTCYAWDEIWSNQFGTISNDCIANGTCTYILDGACDTSFGIGIESRPFCLKHSETPLDLGGGFSGQVFIEDEQGDQKRVTVRVYWSDTTGQHNSDLVTVISRI